MFEGLYFEYPKLFTLIVIFIACDAYCKLRSQALYFPHINILHQEKSPVSTILLWLKWIALSLLVLAMMSPVRDQTISLAADKERSMIFVLENAKYAEKPLLTFQSVKEQVGAFIKDEQSSMFGLTFLNSSPYVAAPVTASYQALQLVLEKSQTEGSKGALEKVLDIALGAFDSRFEGLKVVVVIAQSCEINSKVKTQNLLQAYKEQGIHLYGIDLSVDGNNSAYLKKFAEGSGGAFYQLEDGADLRNILDEIDRLEAINQFDTEFKEYFYVFPLFFSFLLFLILIYLRNRQVQV